MKPTSSDTTRAMACGAVAAVALFAAGANAATVTVYARDGNDVGSGANNAANSGAWTSPGTTSPANEVNGVLTVLTAGAGNGSTPQAYTYNVTDSVSGVNFDFQTTFTAYASNGPGGTWITANKRGQTSVDSSGQESRERTEFLTAGGYSEYARTAFVPGSIVVNTPGYTVSFLNWDSVKMTALTNSVVGEIRESGLTDDPGTVSLVTFVGTDGATQIPALATSSATSIDWVPTAGDQGTATNTGGFGFQSKGFIMNFDVVPIPEPSIAILLGAGLLGLGLRRRR